MIVSPDHASRRAAEGHAALRRVVDGDLLAGAIAFAEKVVPRRSGPKRVRDLKINDGDAEGLLRSSRAQHRRRHRAELPGAAADASVASLPP
jgi:hypothetical protein